MKTITPTDPTALRQSGTTCALLDVRTPAENEKIHVLGVHLVPVDELDPEDLAKTNNFSKGQTIYILCHRGARAERAAYNMEVKGFQDCILVSGGTAAWAAAALPVNQTERRVLPLNHQMQLVAGVMALGGAVLDVTVNPAWVFLFRFVGFGLMQKTNQNIRDGPLESTACSPLENVCKA